MKNNLEWNPYDWLCAIEHTMNDLTAKHNQLVKNNQELTLAYNALSARTKKLEDYINREKDGVKRLTDDVVDELSRTFSKIIKK
jgi:predicted nuclease with TOPRIM domain